MQLTSGMPKPVIGDSIDTASRTDNFLTNDFRIPCSDIGAPYTTSAALPGQALGVFPRFYRTALLVLILSFISVCWRRQHVEQNLRDRLTSVDLQLLSAMIGQL